LAEHVVLWPLLVYAVFVVILAAGMIVVPYFLGQRHRERATGEVYESGMVATGTARLRFPANYYLLAMFFVIFDLESVFIYAWAVSARQAGWVAYGQICIFIALLLAALGYLWGTGALDWGASRPRVGRSSKIDIPGVGDGGDLGRSPYARETGDPGRSSHATEFAPPPEGTDG
jgi:NADH-quinone oxidoreductase subunit A